MAVEDYTTIESCGAPGLLRRHAATFVAAAFLTKLAKHLALLASLAIVGAANGRSPIGQLTILLVIVAAALIHLLGRWVQPQHHRHVGMRQVKP